MYIIELYLRYCYSKIKNAYVSNEVILNEMQSTSYNTDPVFKFLTLIERVVIKILNV